jgi:hypothetical protein
VTPLAYFLGSLALAAGLGLVILALLKLEKRAPEGRVTESCRRHLPGPEAE